ncbi:alpha-L-rhamnosidase C-terminal domain-containing protein [Niabella hibiscisoli]|uniref:alpha-L-rhamnosidase C-terminal domain-containing protein n=1 Tax=Niabella hibiscisoli TaxID=1825928 RepID=UPI00374CBD57
MNPVFPEGLDFVKASLNTKYGEVKSHWKKTAAALEWEITIPANTTTELTLPGNKAAITESGKALTGSVLEKAKEGAAGTTVLTLGSGTYSFVVKR